MWTSYGVEAGAVERRGHLDLAVDALLAQDGHLRPRAAGDERRRDVLRRIEGQAPARCRDRTRRARRCVLLLGAAPGRRAAAASARWFRSTRGAGRPREAPNAVAPARRTVTSPSELGVPTPAAARPCAADTCSTRARSVCAHLQHHAELLGEEPREEAGLAVRRARRVDRHAGVAGEGHLAEGREQAAVRAVVVGEQQAVAAQVGERRIQAPRAAPGRRDPARGRRPARTPAPGSSRRGASGRRAEVDQHQRRRAAVGAQLRRQRARARRRTARRRRR